LKSHSGTWVSSIAHVARRLTGMRRFGRPPLRNHTAHAASAGYAERKYSTIASTFSFVRMVSSIAANRRANVFTP
jgi:hypothetical protein